MFCIALCFRLDHICLCVYPDKDHVYTQLCPHEVSPAIENADLLSFIDARDVYAVTRAIYKVLPGFEREQDHTVNMMFRKSPYFPMMCWAQRQATAPFAPPHSG